MVRATHIARPRNVSAVTTFIVLRAPQAPDTTGAGKPSDTTGAGKPSDTTGAGIPSDTI